MKRAEKEAATIKLIRNEMKIMKIIWYEEMWLTFVKRRKYSSLRYLAAYMMMK